MYTSLLIVLIITVILFPIVEKEDLAFYTMPYCLFFSFTIDGLFQLLKMESALKDLFNCFS